MRVGPRRAQQDEPFEAIAISLDNEERCFVFASSTLPLSCFIFDQRLWPENVAEMVVKALRAMGWAFRRFKIWRAHDGTIQVGLGLGFLAMEPPARLGNRFRRQYGVSGKSYFSRFRIELRLGVICCGNGFCPLALTPKP